MGAEDYSKIPTINSKIPTIIMSSSDCIEHSEVIDPHTGTIVCVDCCRVIGDGLTHFEMNLQKYSTFQENLKDEEEKINGENVIELLYKISDKLHLNRSSIDLAYYEYKKKHKENSEDKCLWWLNSRF